MGAEAVDRVRRELPQLWGRLGPFWGVPPSTAQVYALLITFDEPVDGERIADELGASRGAVSMACRELGDWGLVHAERVPGSRRVLYRIEDDPERIIRGIVSMRKRREWDPILEQVRGWRDELKAARSGEAKVLRQRLGEIEGLIGLVDSMADAFLGGATVPRLGLAALVAAARRKARR